MNKKGLSKEEIFTHLDEFQKKDLKYDSGRILGSMCTEAHPIARQAYIQFLNSNLGDYGLFSGTKQIEEEVIRSLGNILHNEKVYGHVITGGTEANLMAMRAARNFARDKKGITEPEILVPESAHFSFKKASDLMNLKCISLDLDENYCIDIDSLNENISKNTVAVVGVAGTTELGRIDPIPAMSDICYDKDIYLHVDAAFGGFIIPFLKSLGHDLPDFDFKLDGVCSITIDPHKMGLAPIPAGCILFKEKEYLDVMNIDTPYLTMKQQSTLVGTRSGASVAATWAVMNYFGYEGYCELVKEVMDNTHFLAKELVKNDYELVTNPLLNIVSFNSKDTDPDSLAKYLEDNGWFASVSKCPKAIRVVLMPHIKKSHIIELVDCLKKRI